MTHATENPVRVARREHRLTVEQLAFRSGLAVRTIQKAEAGQQPRRKTAVALSEALNTPVEELWPDLTILTGTA